MSLPRPQRPVSPASKPQLVAPAKESPESPQFRPSDVFHFDPQNDITLQELAEMISALEITVHFNRFLKFSEGLRRHFRHKKI